MSMVFHRGRLIDHVQLHAADLAKTRRFYQAIAEALGCADALVDGGEHFYIDEIFVDADAKAPKTRVHLAFQAKDQETVQRFHRAGLAAGGRDNGAPGPRPYHPGYYAAFVLDPDGNNIEAVFHGAAKRSAESVVITPA
jgi:catechol 2,3-dioxygenase-like lactoylglutathione lyase family enzyme